MEYDKSKFTSILITRETKAMLKAYMDEYKIHNTLDLSYHQAIKALLDEHYKNIDNLFVISVEETDINVERNENN